MSGPIPAGSPEVITILVLSETIEDYFACVLLAENYR
jgi:hypothetical protein